LARKRVLVVGLGNMGMSHALAYSRIAGFEVAGLGERRIAARRLPETLADTVEMAEMAVATARRTGKKLVIGYILRGGKGGRTGRKIGRGTSHQFEVADTARLDKRGLGSCEGPLMKSPALDGDSREVRSRAGATLPDTRLRSWRPRARLDRTGAFPRRAPPDRGAPGT
jgi:hypothetical protein